MIHSSEYGAVTLSDLFWLSDVQMARLEPYFPKSHDLAALLTLPSCLANASSLSFG